MTGRVVRCPSIYGFTVGHGAHARGSGSIHLGGIGVGNFGRRGRGKGALVEAIMDRRPRMMIIESDGMRVSI